VKCGTKLIELEATEQCLPVSLPPNEGTIPAENFGTTLAGDQGAELADAEIQCSPTSESTVDCDDTEPDDLRIQIRFPYLLVAGCVSAVDVRFYSPVSGSVSNLRIWLISHGFETDRCGDIECAGFRDVGQLPGGGDPLQTKVQLGRITQEGQVVFECIAKFKTEDGDMVCRGELEKLVVTNPNPNDQNEVHRGMVESKIMIAGDGNNISLNSTKDLQTTLQTEIRDASWINVIWRSTHLENSRRALIPKEYLNVADQGSVLRLVPVGGIHQELRLIARTQFRIGRTGSSSDPNAVLADFLARELPRNSQNDLVTRRVSGIHLVASITASGLVVANSKSGIQTRVQSQGRSHSQTLGNDQTVALHETLVFSLGELHPEGNYEFEAKPLEETALPLEIGNEQEWVGNKIDRAAVPTGIAGIGNVRFAPSRLPSREGHDKVWQAAWIFTSAEFGSSTDGAFPLFDESLAPTQGVIYRHGDCFLLRNLVDNGTVSVSGRTLSINAMIPLSNGQQIAIGQNRYTVSVD